MKIVIVGAGGHGRVVLDILKNNHQFELAGFLDANSNLKRQTRDGLEILGDLSVLPSLSEWGIGGAVVGIGDNRIRVKYAKLIKEEGVHLISAIHPSANIAGTAEIGTNVVIAAGVNICTHVKIENSAILNTGCIIDHESIIREGAHICPGVRLAGHVRIQPGAFIGIGATIIQGITVGESAVVGAGAVVLEDVPAFSTVVGIPARPKWTHAGLDKQVDHSVKTGEKNAVLLPSTADLEPARSVITARPLRRRLVETEPSEVCR